MGNYFLFLCVLQAGLAWVDTQGPTRLPARAGFFNLKNPGGFFLSF